MKTILLSAVLLASATFSHATTVSVSVSVNTTTNSSRQVRDSANSLLLNAGTTVLLGTFATPGSINLGLQTTFSAIAAAGGWTEFNNPPTGTKTIGLSAASRIQGTSTDISANATTFNADSIYLWIFNNSNVNSATQTGIFQDSFFFPNNGAGAGSDSLSIGTTSAVAWAAVAGAGTVGSSTNASLNFFKLTDLTPVPEPSMVCLGGLVGLVGLVARRRNRSV